MRAGSRRGAALLLVMVGVAIAFVMALSFLSSMSTSQGVSQNAARHTRARAIAESAVEFTLAEITSNASWRTTHTHGVWVQDAPFAGGTYTVWGEDDDGNLADNSTDPVTITAKASYQGATHTVKVRAQAGAAAGNAVIVYGEQNQTAPRYRTWNGNAWSAQAAASDGGVKPKWVVARTCPTRSEVAAAVLDDSTDINIQFFNGSSWSAVTELTEDVSADADRAYDAAYEQLSGDLLIVHRYKSSGIFQWRLWNGSTFTAAANLTLPGSGNVKWAKLVPKPNSDEIMLVTLDGSQDVSAAVWNGSAWTNITLLENNAKMAGKEGIAAEYETLTGKCVVAWTAENVNNFQYRTWDGTAWSAESNGPDLGNEPHWLKMAADPASNEVIIGTLDGSSDVKLLVWNGFAWGSPLTVETDVPGTDAQCFDVAYEYGGGKALAVWGRSNQNNCFYRAWNGTSWGAEQSGPGLENKVKWVHMRTGQTAGQVLVCTLNKNSGRIEYMTWNGSALSAPVTIVSDASAANTVGPFMMTLPPSYAWGATAPKLVALYEFQKTSNTPALAGHWKLDDPASAGGIGLASHSTIEVQNNALIDSYNSGAGAYGAGNSGSQAVISTNLTTSAAITIKNNANVKGDAYSGVGSNPSTVISVSGTLTGSKTALTEAVDLPATVSIPGGLPANAGNLDISGTATINSNRHYDKLTIKNNAQVTISGHIIIRCQKGFVVENNAKIIIPNGSSLTIYSDENVDLGNGCEINNDSTAPTRFYLYVTNSSKKLVVSNNAKVAGVLYSAGESEVKNNAILYGMLQSRGKITVSQNGEIHMDTNLANIFGGGGGGSVTVTDQTGASNGTSNGASMQAAGQVGAAASFDGTDDYIAVPHHASHLLSEGAVSFWFKSANPSLAKGLVSKDSAGYDTGGQFYIRTNAGKIEARIESSTSSYDIAGGTLAANTWYHVVFSFGPGGMRLYLNGALIASGPYQGGLTGNTQPLVIGASTSAAGNGVATPIAEPFAGTLDDVRLYNKPLDAAQATNLYNGSDPGSGAEPTIADSSGYSPSLPLTVEQMAYASFIAGGGIDITGDTRLMTSAAAAKLHTALAATNEATIELTFTPANLTQTDKRILSYGSSSSAANLAVSQQVSSYDARLRTSTTASSGQPALTPSDALNTTDQHQVVIAFGNAVVNIYRNGNLVHTAPRAGDLSTWSSAYRLILANDDAEEQPWRGKLHRVAIYDRAFDQSQAQNVFNGQAPGGTGGSGGGTGGFTVTWLEQP